jgi:hypothetical protein
MKLLFAAGAVLLSAAVPGTAHRVDEYLQATLLSIEKDHVSAQLRLVPGIAVVPFVLASIDADRDGLLSIAEQKAYAERVLRDIALTIGGDPLRLQLISANFATIEEMKEGRGEIQLQVRATLPPGGRNRRLIYENHHQRGIAAYLVSSAVPRDPSIRITGQSRNDDQSVYQLDYEQPGVSPLSLSWWSAGRLWTGAAAVFLLARLALLGRAGRRQSRSSATHSMLSGS